MYNPRAGGKGKESWSGGASLLCLERKGSEADSGGAIGVYDTLGVRFFLLFILWILIRWFRALRRGGSALELSEAGAVPRERYGREWRRWKECGFRHF